MGFRRTAIDDLERIHPRTRAAWRSWLQANHRTSPGCWLVSYRTRTGKPRVEYAEAVEEMLCFGWRREILAWILQAKRPGTRARRVQETARLAAKNVRANQRR